MMKSFFSYLFIRHYELRSKMPKDGLLRVVGKAHNEWSEKNVQYRVKVDGDSFNMLEIARMPSFVGFASRGYYASAEAQLREEDGETVIAIRLGLSPAALVLTWIFVAIMGILSCMSAFELVFTGVDAIKGVIPMDWTPLGEIFFFGFFFCIFRFFYGRSIRQMEEYLEELLIF